MAKTTTQISAATKISTLIVEPNVVNHTLNPVEWDEWWNNMAQDDRWRLNGLVTARNAIFRPTGQRVVAA